MLDDDTLMMAKADARRQPDATIKNAFREAPKGKKFRSAGKGIIANKPCSSSQVFP
jgi:hypothetical protein